MINLTTKLLTQSQCSDLVIKEISKIHTYGWYQDYHIVIAVLVGAVLGILIGHMYKKIK